MGTIATFGDAFPWSPPAAVPPGLLPEVWWPRNCLPSVHTATGLIRLWNTRPGTRLRLVTIACFFAMMVYTVVGGGHCVVDLIATAFYLAWVVMVRGGLLSASPIVPWLFTAVTRAASLWLRRRVGVRAPLPETAQLH